ncbi:MAG: hypothetical protein NTY03_01285 [Candidatus Bathyarchaeota archaeon]|nr:hypothetical protein [Candidatus Bathyarchaeota archaeon]
MSSYNPSRSSKSRDRRKSPYRHVVKAHPRESNHGKQFHVPSYVRGRGLPQRPEFKTRDYLTPETEAEERVYCSECPKRGGPKCRPYGSWCADMPDNCNRSIKCHYARTEKCSAENCPDKVVESPEHEEEEQAEAGLREELDEGTHPVVSVRTSAGVGPEADIASIYSEEIEKWAEEHGVRDISHVSKSEMDFLRKGVAEVRDRAQERVWSEVDHNELQLLAKRMGYNNAEAALSQSDNWVADYLDCRNEFQGDKK